MLDNVVESTIKIVIYSIMCFLSLNILHCGLLIKLQVQDQIMMSWSHPGWIYAAYALYSM